VKTTIRPEICPVCHASDVEKLLLVSSVLQLFGTSRSCNRCGTIWAPPCPKWGAWTLFVLGGIILLTSGSFVVFVLTVYSEPYLLSIFGIPVEREFFSRPFCLWGTLYGSAFLFLGVYVVVYAVRVLRGKAGGVKIIRLGKKEDGVKIIK
jgi:hypothetical protein